MFLEQLNEDLTKDNVNRLLSNYHRIKRLAGNSSPSMTSTYSAVPRSFTGETSNPTSDLVQMREKAHIQLKEIETALKYLSEDARDRLYFKYISDDQKYDYEIYNHQNISKDTYYRELKKAQLEFAEAYKGGELIVFDYKRKKSD